LLLIEADVVFSIGERTDMSGEEAKVTSNIHLPGVWKKGGKKLIQATGKPVCSLINTGEDHLGFFGLQTTFLLLLHGG
jgi:hypothetical protein